MSDNETPFPPASGAQSAGPDDTNDTEARDSAAGKVIGEEVFLARLAERRQAERASAMSEPPVIDVILGALESIGLDPEQVAPDFVRMSRASATSGDDIPDSAPPSLEEMALEQALLDDLRKGMASSLGAQDLRDTARQAALLRLAASMDPDELAGIGELAGFTPEQEAALFAGLDAGTRNAVRKVGQGRPARPRRRSGSRRVAETRAPYTTGQIDPAAGEQSDQPGEPDKNGPKR